MKVEPRCLDFDDVDEEVKPVPLSHLASADELGVSCLADCFQNWKAQTLNINRCIGMEYDGLRNEILDMFFKKMPNTSSFFGNNILAIAQVDCNTSK